MRKLKVFFGLPRIDGTTMELSKEAKFLDVFAFYITLRIVREVFRCCKSNESDRNKPITLLSYEIVRERY